MFNFQDYDFFSISNLILQPVNAKSIAALDIQIMSTIVLHYNIKKSKFKKSLCHYHREIDSFVF